MAWNGLIRFWSLQIKKNFKHSCCKGKLSISLQKILCHHFDIVVALLQLVLLRVFSAVYVNTNQISKFLAAGPTFLLFLILIHSKTGVYLDLKKALFIERVTEPCCARSETIDIDILKTPSLCTFLFLKMIIFLPRTTTINIESSEELGVCSGCT